MRASVRDPRRIEDERGFVLIGVVMFVLALTILGLSLFGLSSYEAQFVGRSYNSGQALITAQSAIDRAKFVLAKKRDLTLVRTTLGDYPAGTYYACAWQDHEAPDDDSSGTMIPDTTVRIRVGVAISGERRMVEVQYKPTEESNIYKRLATTHDGVFVNDDHLGTPICGRVVLNGRVYETAHDPSSSLCAISDAPYGIRFWPATVPKPAVATFKTTFAGTAQYVAPNPVGETFNLTVSGGGVGFFYTPGTDPVGLKNGYSVYMSSAPTATINVQGKAIWIVDHGFRSDQPVEVHGGANDCLVIVSGKNQNPDVDEAQWLDVGVWFFGGLKSTTVPVILVSDGRVQIEHFNAFDGSSDVSYLSAFAQRVWLGGPQTNYLRLSHNPNSPYDDAGGLIDQLCDDGYLPNSSSLSVKFTSIAGTWRELDPDNPPVIN